MQKRLLIEIVTLKLVGISPGSSIIEAAEIMKHHNFSCIPVLEGKKVVGIVTERSIVSYSAHEKMSPNGRSVQDLMSKPVLTANQNMDILAAFNLLTANNIRHLVVVDDDDQAIGMVTLSNIIRHLGHEYFIEMRKVNQIMAKPVLTIASNTNLKETVRLMAEKLVSCLIVAENDRPLGIVTERDIIKLLISGKNFSSVKVKEIMSSPVITASPNTYILQVAELMNRKNIRRMIVVDQENRLIGLITQSDIIKGLENKYIEDLKSAVKEKDLIFSKAVQELSEKAVYLDNILCSAMDLGIVATEPSGCIAYYNPTAEQLLGAPVHEIVGKDLAHIHQQQKVEPSRFQFFLDNLAEKRKHSFIIKREHESGSSFLRAQVSGIWDLNEELVGLVMMIRDISERKQAEEELKRINEELKDIVHVVSHELKSPLIAIQGFSSRLAKNCSETIGTQGQTYIEHIDASTRRMEHLISDLLARSSVDKTPSLYNEVSFDDIVDQVITVLQDRLIEKGVRIKVKDTLPVIRCDGEKIHQVFENLLTNALKYMENNTNPTIEILYKEKEDVHQFSVQDNGRGIHSKYHQDIFTKYYRLKEVANAEGTGLGLSIVKKIITDGGGDIWLQSEPGQGAAFYFTVPKVS